ncbi:hypothetical protein QO206_03360 [Leeuwenhoekiella aequorea]|uniref:hypothetical protein n=1 Tax=Leeuwenhoekiella aequorea TaxID=283736 RepID=UPI00352E9CE5|tara:strand:+ start:22445 stop:22984 length:540 start_codon:yes stop_codon:yes gene_type:complete
MKTEEIAKSIFARNKDINELHITADGQAFRELHAAESHAQRSKDQKIVSINRKGDTENKAPDADPEQTFANKATEVAKANTVKETVNKNAPAAASKDAKDIDVNGATVETGASADQDEDLEAILDGNVKTVTERLSNIDQEETLDALAALETAKGDTSRKTVHEAIEARKNTITNPKAD